MRAKVRFVKTTLLVAAAAVIARADKINDTVSAAGDTIVTVSESYEGGGMKSRTVYRNGLRHGPEVEYYATGQIKDSIVYREGEIMEDWHWYANGKMQSYMRSSKPGVIRDGRFFDMAGNQVGAIKRGKGTVYKFSEEGKLIETYDVKNGVFAE